MKAFVYIALMCILASSCSSDDKRESDVKFPTHIVVSVPSPDSTVAAVLYHWKIAGDDLLGANDRWSLGFVRGETKWHIERELGEGHGTYEGGVLDIEWVDGHRVKVIRRLDDQDANLLFDLRSNEFSPAE
ncbi:MAG: hypothetical protein IPG74_14025 [Flavobacteriales bacterium]|nr:hypothetical protein [Flavobacteriales bacterium]MBK7554425.1 hypothetical protein [Flavobacteriales bacterium]